MEILALGHSSEPLSRDVLSCLGACNHLQTLSLHLKQPVHLTDQELSLAISGLPRLKSLKIKARQDSLLTLRALAIITESCPDIEHISLHLDAMQGLDTPINVLANHLRKVNPQEGPIADVNAVAAFLSRLSSENFSIKASGSLWWRVVKERRNFLQS